MKVSGVGCQVSGDKAVKFRCYTATLQKPFRSNRSLCSPTAALTPDTLMLDPLSFVLISTVNYANNLILDAGQSIIISFYPESSRRSPVSLIHSSLNIFNGWAVINPKRIISNTINCEDRNMPIAEKMVKMVEVSSMIKQMVEEGARLKAVHGSDNVFDFSLGNPDVPPPPEF